MPFSEIFYHFLLKVEPEEGQLNKITEKLVETKLSEEVVALGGQALAVKLMHDHAHLLVAAPPEASPDAIISELIEGTEELVSGTGRNESLKWAKDYGVVSVSRSHLDIVRDYIETQENRHNSAKVNATLEKNIIEEK